VSRMTADPVARKVMTRPQYPHYLLVPAIRRPSLPPTGVKKMTPVNPRVACWVASAEQRALAQTAASVSRMTADPVARLSRLPGVAIASVRTANTVSSSTWSVLKLHVLPSRLASLIELLKQIVNPRRSRSLAHATELEDPSEPKPP